jgi:hypothetical protein
MELVLQLTLSVTGGSWGALETWTAIAGCGGFHELIEADGLASPMIHHELCRQVQGWWRFRPHFRLERAL